MLDGVRAEARAAAQMAKSPSAPLQVLVCGRHQCGVRNMPLTTFTPMYGTRMTHQSYWRVAWCFANQERIDQTVELSDVSEDVISRCFACHRDVVAWWSVRMGRDLTFGAGEVDIDVAKHAVVRSDPHENVHTGRR